eukprot:GHVT01034935.1.p1 GENE.GHVT01034935.1~~GHVT01034935.1.p1  ORF type:complete len:332 (+),score=37.69 GHVT01034935.1:605-1600(+)
MFWDFLSLVPESIHQVTILFSDRGTPDGYRHMNGYGSHTFKLVNRARSCFYVKFHLKTAQGIKNLPASTADELSGRDPDYATRDLFDAIKSGRYPSWKMYVQVMPVHTAQSYPINVLDVTKVWPHKDFPLIEVGTLTLNRNPQNYHAEIEQVAFSPAHLVPGIEASEDKMLQGRLFSYADTHRHRLGGNYDQIPVNRSRNQRADYYNRDGLMSVDGNKGSLPNYEPNSILGTPKEAGEGAGASLHRQPVAGVVARHADCHPNDDFEQAGNLFRNVMSETERSNLIENIAGHLGNASKPIQQRMVRVFSRADKDYGRRVAQRLGLSPPPARL